MKVSLEDKEIVIRIPEGVLSVEYIQNLIERFELEEFVKDAKMSEEDAWTLSEKIKEEWWEKEGKEGKNFAFDRNAILVYAENYTSKQEGKYGACN